MQTTWNLLGNDAHLRIAESRRDPFSTPTTYDEAKQQALDQLYHHVAPYLQRIAELESDHDKDAGSLPLLKVWETNNCRRKRLVVAPSKRRATELSQSSRYSFNRRYEEAHDDWWYSIARNGEGLWIEEVDDQTKGTGIFYRPLERAEAEQIVENELAYYRRMSTDRLTAKIGQKTTSTGESALGTPYKITTSIDVFDWKPNQIHVGVEIDDCLEWWHSRVWSHFSRPLPKTTVDWRQEGF